MYRIDSDGSVTSLPTPSALNTEGYWFRGNPETGQAATLEDQDWFNAIQESLIAFLTASGLAHSKSDYSRLWQSIGRAVTFPDVGSANAVAIALPAGLTFPSGSVGLGTSLRVKLAFAFTGAATFAPFGLAPAPILRLDGSAVGAGDAVAGALVELVNDGAGNWQLLAGGRPGLVTAVSPTIYVRTDGNDANDGSANSSAKALATINAALALAKRYYVPGGSITIQLGNPGTYAAPSIPMMGTPIVVRGDPASPASYIVAGNGTNTAVFYVQGANVTFQGVMLESLNNFNLVAAAYGGSLMLSNVVLHANGTNTQAALRSFIGGSITLGSGITVDASFGYLLLANGGGITAQVGATVAASGTPNFSVATVFATDGSAVTLGGSTWSGAATGARYQAIANGIIDTQGGGASFIFGNSAGSTATGAQYV